MPERGYIEIRITNKSNTLSPKDVDISEIKSIISDVETFLYPTRAEKLNRPHISYSIEEGSARNIFILPLTSVIIFNSLTKEISKRESINFLERPQQVAISNFQKVAAKKDYTIQFNTSIQQDTVLEINPLTKYQINEAQNFESEFYLYGEIYQEGGKEPNLHITTKEYGNLVIAANKRQIMEGEKKTYRLYGVKVRGKRNILDNSISDLKLIEFIRYNPKFDRGKFDAILAKASSNLNKIPDTDEHVNFVKGVWME